MVDEINYETRTKIDYHSIFIHIRRINRLLNVIFQDINNEDIRKDVLLITSLNQLTSELVKIRQRLSKKGSQETCLPFLEYSEQNIDHELIFIYATVNRVINETNELNKSLTQVGV